ncbi:MAG TPA: hypothetical protein VF145_00160 [Chitinophagaceae bacterium]
MAKIIILNNPVAGMVPEMRSLAGLHTVEFVGTTGSLMSSLKLATPDVIIINVVLKDDDGRKVSKMLETESVHGQIPVILVSPYYHTDSEIRSFCCDELLSMPLESGILSASVAMLIAKRAARASRTEKA